MARKPETNFRINTVYPDLAKLPNTEWESIQQVAIRGSFDIILCINGLFVGLELKDIGEELRPLQEYKALRVRKAGGITFRADRTNWPGVYEELQKLAQGENNGKSTTSKSSAKRGP